MAAGERCCCCNRRLVNGGFESNGVICTRKCAFNWAVIHFGGQRHPRLPHPMSVRARPDAVLKIADAPGGE